MTRPEPIERVGLFLGITPRDPNAGSPKHPTPLAFKSWEPAENIMFLGHSDVDKMDFYLSVRKPERMATDAQYYSDDDKPDMLMWLYGVSPEGDVRLIFGREFTVHFEEHAYTTKS